MKSAPKHPNEEARLQALHRLQILDSMPVQEFDDITRIASQICGVPIALVSLIDENRQWFMSKRGVDAAETHRDFAFCAHAILEDGTFVIPDARLDDRFKDNPLVTDGPKAVFYAGSPILSPDGHPIGTLCVVDHEPRKLNEDQLYALSALSNQVNRLLELKSQLRQRDEDYQRLEYKRAAIESLQEGVVFQDATSAVLECNQAALDALEITKDQLSGKTCMDPQWRTIYEDGSNFPAESHPSLIALRTGQKQKNIIMGIHTGAAHLKWMSMSATPLFLDGSGKATHVVSSFSDVTEQMHDRKIIEKKERDLKKVMNGIPEMIGHWSSDLTNLNSNKAYAGYFGKTPEQMKGVKMSEIFNADLFASVQSNLKIALSGTSVTFETDLRKSDGKIKHALGTYIPDFEDGKVTGIFVVISDVSELKRLEHERQEMAAKLVESSKLSTLGEMAGGVAHEINTPLAVIGTKTSMLLESIERGDLQPQDAVMQLRKIKATADRIGKIVKGLRLFSRNSANDPKENVSVCQVVDLTLDLCREKLLQSNIELRTQWGPPLQISGRSTELSQVIMNLIGNSVDAIKNSEKRWIEIKTELQNDYAVISVTDSGQGIPEGVARKMMNPFFTTKDVGQGTGLGLSISTGIAEAHEGRLFYDEKSANTRFVLEIPTVQSMIKAEAA